MEKPPAKIGELFAPDDLVAQFVVSISAQRNDLGEAVRQVVAAAQAERNVARYYHRLLASHFSEAAKWLKHAVEIPEVAAWLEQLPTDAKEDLDAVLITTGRRGLVKTVLWSGRAATFHYPAIGVEQDGLREAMEAIRELPAVMSAVKEDDGRWHPRADFAEELLTYRQLHTFGDDLAARMSLIQQAAIRHAHLADACLRRYLAERGHYLGEPTIT